MSRMGKKIKDIADYEYGYYYSSSYENVENKLFGNYQVGINCNDFDYVEELNNKLKVEYIKENIMRKPTPEEMEWIKKQEPITDPEVLEEIMPVIKWLEKYGAFE